MHITNGNRRLLRRGRIAGIITQLRRIAVGAKTFALVVLAMLAACSTVSDAVHPGRWFESDSEKTSERPTDAATAEAEKEPYPNLASVPDRPSRQSTPAEREKMTKGLISDRENARYTEESLQPRSAQGGPPPASPPAQSTAQPARPAAPRTATAAAASPPAAPAAAAAQSAAPVSSQPGATLDSAPPPSVDLSPQAIAPSSSTKSPEPPALPNPAPPAASPPAAPAPPQSAQAPASAQSSATVSPTGRALPPPPPSGPVTEPVPPPPPASVSGQAPAAPSQQAARAPSPAPAPSAQASRPAPPSSGQAASSGAVASAAGSNQTVDQVYRDQLAKSAASAAPPPPQPEPPLPPLRRPTGALTHVARGLPPGAGGAPSFTAAPPFVAGVGGGTLASADDPVTTIGFAAGSSKLSAADRREIARVVALARQGVSQVRVIGHAGREGEGGAEGLRLSLDRADAVAGELTRQGMLADHITASGVGASEPIVVAGSAAAEAPNRRVEIFLDY